jgi:hypothetical protein
MSLFEGLEQGFALALGGRPGRVYQKWQLGGRIKLENTSGSTNLPKHITRRENRSQGGFLLWSSEIPVYDDFADDLDCPGVGILC